MNSFGSASRGGGALALFATVAAAAVVQPAFAQDQVRRFDVPPLPASAGIPEFARQADIQILVSARVSAGRRTNAVRGAMPVRQGLEALLQGTGLRVVTDDGRTITLGAVAPVASAGEDANRVDELVVTANKREENVQDVAMSVRALTQQALQKQGADDFADYYRTVPSLTLQERSPGFNTISIRGVVAIGHSTSGTAGIYYDDIPVSSEGFQSDIKLVDVERVEVLRGPQGTLYGEGSMGGTVKVITRKPDPGRFEGELTAQALSTAHGGDGGRLDGVVNIPLGDKAAVRIVGYRRDEAGWIDNLALGDKDANKEVTDGGRISFRAIPTDRLTATATALYQNQRVGGAQNIDSGLGDYVQFRRTVENSGDRYAEYNFTLENRLDWATLVSSTSYFDRRFTFHRDLQALADALGGTSSFIDNLRPTHTFTEEVRLSSAGEGPLQYTLGVFDKHQVEGDHETAVVDFGVPIDFFKADAGLVLNQKAVFGEVSYRPLERLKLTAGLRGFEEHQRIDTTQALLGSPLPSFHGELTSRTVTPKFAADFQIDDDRMIYAVAAEGFRSGGVNSVTGPGVRQTYDPDHLWNYEIGLKSYLLDRRVTLNLAAFYIDWSNIQISVPDPNVTGLSFLDNAGKAHSTGVEAELTARPTDGLELGASFGYDEAILHELSRNGAVLYQRGRLPNVPRTRYSFSAEYARPIRDGLDAFGRVDFSHVGSSLNAVDQPGGPPPTVQKAYSLTNIRAGLRHDRWDLELFVENVFDTLAQLNVDPNLSTPGNPVIAINRPRTVGVLLRSRF